MTMSVYGMGSMFSSTDEQLDNFINEGFVCVGWKQNQKPELYTILSNIKVGDIIYVKALPFNSKSMKIKAVAIVIEKLKNKNTHKGYEDCENEIGVKWISTNINKSINVDDSSLNKRKESVFVETNCDYIKRIINLI